MRVYLDNCALNRLYDDQSQDRIRLEAVAVSLVMKHFQERSWTWIGGEILDWEVRRTPDRERRRKLTVLTGWVSDRVPLTAGLKERGLTLRSTGFKWRDALHVASAEVGRADVFLTTDDAVLKRASSLADQLEVRVENPRNWVGL